MIEIIIIILLVLVLSGGSYKNNRGGGYTIKQKPTTSKPKINPQPRPKSKEQK